MSYEKKLALLLAGYTGSTNSAIETAELLRLLGARTFDRGIPCGLPEPVQPQHHMLVSDAIAQAILFNNELFTLPIGDGVIHKSKSLFGLREGFMLLDTASRQGKWRGCLLSRATAYSFASFLLSIEVLLQEGRLLGADQCTAKYMRYAVGAIMSEWVGSSNLYSADPSSTNLARTLFGDPWCMWHLDGVEEWKITHYVATLCPPFLRGFVPAQDSLPEARPEFPLPDLEN